MTTHRVITRRRTGKRRLTRTERRAVAMRNLRKAHAANRRRARRR